MKLPSTTKWCAFLTAAILLFYWKLFYPAQFTPLTGAEDANQAYSWFNYWVRALHQGAPPIWDPYANAGYCFPGEMQTGAFYPLYLLLLIVPLNRAGMISPIEYHSVMLLGHVLAALFMFAFIRELGLSQFAAFLGGFCFSEGGFVGRVGWPHLLHSSIWMPLVFLFLVRALKHRDPRRTVPNAVISGFFLGVAFLAGGLHIAMAQGIAVLIALAFYAAYRREREEAFPWMNLPWRRALFLAAIVLGISVCAGAIQLFPSHLYASRSLRWYGGAAFLATQKPPYMYTSQDGLWPGAIMSFLFPSYEGMGYGEVWTGYVGVFPFILAAAAVWKRWSCLFVRYFVFLGIGAFVYSLTILSPLHGVLYALVPWLWMAREATRFMYLAGFSLAVLAAYGTDLVFSASLAELVPRNAKRVLSWAIAAVLLIFCLPVLAPKLASPWVYFSFLLILASFILLRFVFVRDAFLQRGFRLLVLALVFFDLNAFNSGVSNRIEADKAGTDEYETLLSLRDAVRFLRAQPQPFRVKIFRERQPNIGDAFGVQSVFGAGVTLGVDFSKVHDEYNLLNAVYFIRPASFAEPNPVYQDSQWKIYRNASAFPRAWLVHKTKVESTDEDLYQDIYNHRVDLHQVALLNAPLRENRETAPASGNESARLQTYSAEQMEFAVNAQSPALLVLSEIYYPEWKAWVNGKSAQIIRTNGAFRSVLVPAGSSTVELIYRPWSVYIGALFSLIAFALAFAGLILESRVSERESPPELSLTYSPL